jgi:hypothetical protein
LGLFGYFYGLARSFFLATDFIEDPSLPYSIFWRIATVFILVALLILVLILETYVVKTKYIFTVIGVIGLIFAVALKIETARWVTAVFGGISTLVIFSIYLYIVKKSVGKSRVNAMIYAICILLMAFGHFMDGIYATALLGFDAGIIATSLMTIGIVYYLKLYYSD